MQIDGLKHKVYTQAERMAAAVEGTYTQHVCIHNALSVKYVMYFTHGHTSTGNIYYKR